MQQDINHEIIDDIVNIIKDSLEKEEFNESQIKTLILLVHPQPITTKRGYYILNKIDKDKRLDALKKFSFLFISIFDNCKDEKSPILTPAYQYLDLFDDDKRMDVINILDKAFGRLMKNDLLSVLKHIQYTYHIELINRFHRSSTKYFKEHGEWIRRYIRPEIKDELFKLFPSCFPPIKEEEPVFNIDRTRPVIVPDGLSYTMFNLKTNPYGEF